MGTVNNNSIVILFLCVQIDICIADREDDGLPKGQVDAPASDYQQPPPHTYAFPPNSHSDYPPPSPKKPISVPSYLPPPSGPTNYPIYPGPLAPKDAVSTLNTQVDNSDSVDGMNDLSDVNGTPGNDDDKNDANMDNVNDNPDRPSDDTKLINRPPLGPPENFLPTKKPDFPSIPFIDQDSHDHHYEHEHEHEHVHHFEHEHEHIHDHLPHEHIHDHPPHEHIHDHPLHDHQFYDSFHPYDDSLKHLHGFEAFPGNFNLMLSIFRSLKRSKNSICAMHIVHVFYSMFIEMENMINHNVKPISSNGIFEKRLLPHHYFHFN